MEEKNNQVIRTLQDHEEAMRLARDMRREDKMRAETNNLNENIKKLIKCIEELNIRIKQLTRG